MIRDNVLVFDLDDTLFSEKDFVLSGFRAVSNWLEEEKNIKGFFGHSKMFYLNGARGNIFDKTLDILNINYSQEFVSKLVNIYRTHSPSICLSKDAVWAINYFCEYYFLAILTDGYLETQKRKIKALGLDNMVDFIVCSDKYGKLAWKPSNIPYLKIMQYFGKDKKFFYIADNVEKDFITAKKLGWVTIHIKRDFGEYINVKKTPEYEAEYQLSTLYDLNQLIN